METDHFSVFDHETTPHVQCEINDSAYRLPIWVTIVDIYGKAQLRFLTTLNTKSPLHLTMHTIMNHRRVRLWACTHDKAYTHVTPFLHTKLFLAHSLHDHPHLQSHDTLCCIAATDRQVHHMHKSIDRWIHLHTQTHCSSSHHKTQPYKTQPFKLQTIYAMRRKYYKEDHLHATILHRHAIHWTSFQQHLMMTWIHQLAFIYRLHQLRKQPKQFKHWLHFHSTLIVNSLWNDYAFHTQRVFDGCARVLHVAEWNPSQYMIDHWDINYYLLLKQDGSRLYDEAFVDAE